MEKKMENGMEARSPLQGVYWHLIGIHVLVWGLQGLFGGYMGLYRLYGLYSV